jgi:hypothetical protein
MAGPAANVASIEALRVLRLALVQFQSEADSGLTQLELEGRRPGPWIDNDRRMYWQREVRKASDALAEARMALERAEMTTSAEDHRYAYDERKALERAKRRLRLCEEKVELVRKWRSVVHKEVEEFEVQVAKFRRFLETDFVQGIAALQRMADALERYTQQRPADEQS